MEDKVNELQMLVMEQQQSIETLSDTLIQQSSRIAELEKKLTLVESRLQRVSDQNGSDEQVSEDRPPHY